MFGVVPWPDGAWAIWMLGSDRIVARAKALMRISRDWLERLRELNDLHAIMDARNTLHRRYCERLGARVAWTYLDFGVNKEPFLHLTWPKNV